MYEEEAAPLPGFHQSPAEEVIEGVPESKDEDGEIEAPGGTPQRGRIQVTVSRICGCLLG